MTAELGTEAKPADATSDSQRPSRAGGRIDHVHYFRGMAILLIVATHVLSFFDWREHRELERVLKYSVANGTILFLFISGFLFDYLARDFQVLSFWGKKARFVALPYVIVSIPALVAFTTVMRREEVRAGFYDQPVWAQCWEFLLTGKHLAPFWFIPTILSFYLVAPLLHRAFRSDRSFLSLPLLFLLPYFFPRADNPLLNIPHFLPVWVMGMAASRFRNHAEGLARRGWPFFLVLVIGLGYLEFTYTKGTHTYLGYLQKSALIAFCFSVFVLLGRLPDRLLSSVAALSFGIFFVHSYVITAGKMIWARVVGDMPPGNLAGVLLAALLATVLSVWIVKGLRIALRPYSRHVIGV